MYLLLIKKKADLYVVGRLISVEDGARRGPAPYPSPIASRGEWTPFSAVSWARVSSGARTRERTGSCHEPPAAEGRGPGGTTCFRTKQESRDKIYRLLIRGVGTRFRGRTAVRAVLPRNTPVRSPLPPTPTGRATPARPTRFN